EVFPTAAPRPDTPPPPAEEGTTVLEIASVNSVFDTRTLTAAAGKPVQITFDNQDAGLVHNVAFYTSPQATTPIFRGEIFPGIEIRTETFDAPETPGNYFFRCDAHPDTMTGTFIVQ